MHPQTAYDKDRRGFVHGMSGTPLYIVWISMKQRCYYTNAIRYQNYGGRGIKVCNKWKHNFVNFYNWALSNGWEEGLQLDRIDNDGNYNPSNCKFSTPKENSNNRSMQYNNTSGFVGVTRYPFERHRKRKTMKKPWTAYVYINRKRKHIGYYSTPLEAAVARDEYIMDNQLQHKLNFGGYHE